MQRRLSRRAVLRSGVLGAGLFWLGTTACGSGGSANKSASSNSNATTTASKAPVSIKTSYVGSGPEISAFVAKDAGIFQKHGLEVDQQLIAGPTAIAAVIAGEIQFADAGGGETLNAVAQGAPLTVLATLCPVFPDKFYTRADITNPSQLKGKKVAITQPGGTYDVGLRLLLPKLGLTPDKDVSFISTGTIANVNTALLNGAVDGALISVGPQSAKVESQGFHALEDLSSVDLLFPTLIVVAQRAYVNAHKDVAQRYVDALVEANVRFKQDKPLTFQAITKLYKTTDQTGFEDFYQYYTQDRVVPTLPYPRAEQFKSAQDTGCKQTAAVCNVDVTKIVDASLVDSTDKRGIGS